MIESAPTKVVTISGTEMYYENGILSRPDGPAIIYPGGDEEWWLKGMLHRHDPATPDVLYPAVTRWATMEFEYWIKGVFICKNPDAGQIIIEWDGWIKDGEDLSTNPAKFQIIRPEPKYKSIYTPTRIPRDDSKKIHGGRAYGRVTHHQGDEESWT